MAIVDLRSLLKQAKEGNFAVGSFNVFNFETLSAVVSVAEEMKVPVVIGLSERLFRFADVDGLAVAMVRTAYRSSAPIAVQLDHGRTYEGIIRAIRWGFNAVMYDGSHLSTDENIKRTREIARLARAAGVALEAELDCQHLITPSGGVNISLTDEFAAKTRVDVLAVCYNRRQEGERREIIDDLPQIRELAARMDRPLSLHMNAKRSRAEYRQIIGSGIRKINIPTEMSVAAVDAIKKELADKPNVNLVNLMSVVRRGVKNIARQYMICLDCIPRGKKQT